MSTPSFLPLQPQQFGLSDPLCDDILLLDRCLGDVLREQDGAGLLEVAHRLYSDHGDPATLPERVSELQDSPTMLRLLRAFTVFFQLLNTAEQKEIVRVNRARQTPGKPRPESIGEAVRRLRDTGMTPEAMQELLCRVHICPTLTAHPTEARRRAVLDKLQRIAAALVERSQPPALPRLDVPLNSPGRAEQELERTLTALWQTDELRASQITVEDEVRNGLYFFEHTIVDVIPWLHDDLRDALAEAYPGHAFEIPPFIQYRSWVGGDRDGNPNVTPDVTWRTLLAHKELILRYYQAQVEQLQRELTNSARLVGVSEELMESLQRDRDTVPMAAEPRGRFTAEPYGLKLLYVRARLQATLEHLEGLTDFRAEGPAFGARMPAYAASAEFLEDLLLIERSLREHHGEALARTGTLAHLVVRARTCGFHLAALDIRQHSDEHEKVLEEMLAAARVLPPDRPYSSLEEAEKVRLLTRELLSPRPLLPRGWPASEGASGVLQVFEVMRHAQRYISRSATPTYIISMTHGVSDLLEVLLLAREEGLLRWRMERERPVLESDLDVVPLFETIDDLHGCRELMRRLFANQAYRHQLQARGRFQEIMLGYSDSSKDGGYLAANVALHETQAQLAKVCQDAGVTLRFFHGRGGTVGRGGGRANQAILSQPLNGFSGRIRFTEQGEVISFRYSLLPIAHRHLEQIASAVLLAAGDPSLRKGEPGHWRRAAREMAAHSRTVYRDLVYDDPDFWTFYMQATPIQHISRLPIASRPVFRPGKMAGPHHLRAVPWVFAWVQSRYVLPGWYGLGSGLEWLAGQEEANLELLRRMYAKWPFFRTTIDNAQLELLRAHLPTAAWYAARMESREAGQRLHGVIEGEFARTREWVLRVTGQEELLENAPVIRRTVELRNPVLAPLSKLQVALLDLWDRHAEADQEPPAPWRDAILLSIIGVAAGMQSTG